MYLALALFLATYVLLLIFGKYRAYIAAASALLFVVLGILPWAEVPAAIDWNVLLMIAGTMGTVVLFIESRMPALMADIIMEKVPNIKWAVVALSLFGRADLRFRGQCGHSADGRACGAGAGQKAGHQPCAGHHRHCGVLQSAGRGHAGGRYHIHSAGRLCRHEFS